MDQDGEHSWGDVNENSVIEVYRGKVASRYRSMHASGKRKDIEPCGTCNLFWPDLRTGSVFRSAKVAAEFGMYVMRNKPTGRKAPAPKPPEIAKPLPII